MLSSSPSCRFALEVSHTDQPLFLVNRMQPQAYCLSLYIVYLMLSWLMTGALFRLGGTHSGEDGGTHLWSPLPEAWARAGSALPTSKQIGRSSSEGSLQDDSPLAEALWVVTLSYCGTSTLSVLAHCLTVVLARIVYLRQGTALHMNWDLRLSISKVNSLERSLVCH